MRDDALLTLLEELHANAERGEAPGAQSLALARELARGTFDAVAKDGPSRPAADVIAAYLDGRLDGAAREDFEQRLVDSPDLLAEVELLADRLDAAVSGRNVGDAVTLDSIQADLSRGVPLGPDQQRALFRDPALRSAFNRWVGRANVASTQTIAATAFASVGKELPMRIAASTGRKLTQRHFDGGALHVMSAGRPHLVRIEVASEGEAIEASALALVGLDGRVGLIELPPAESDGRVTAILDLRVAADVEALELLEDPMTTGRFVTP